MLTIKNYFLELFIILVLWADLFIQRLPMLPVSCVIIAIQFIRLDLASNIFLSIVLLNYVVGAVFGVLGISHGASVIMSLGLVLLVYGYFTKKITIKERGGLKSLFFLFGVLLASILISTGGDYAWDKLLKTVIYGLFTYIGFATLFSNIEKVRQVYGLYPVIYAFLLLRLSILVNQIPGPSNLVDFGFLRMQTGIYSDDDATVIAYHIIGYYCLQGFALLLIKDKVKSLTSALLLFICIMACLYSGARQTIIVAFFVIFLYFFLLSNRKIVGYVLILSISAAILFLFSQSDFFESAFGLIRDYGYLTGSNRDEFIGKGMKDFIGNPIFGVGYGRFYINGAYGSYPHNMIVELLAELGIVGTTLVLSLLLFHIAKAWDCLKRYLIYFVILFMQAMVSRGLDTNIVVFSFAITCSLLNRSILPPKSCK